MKHIRRLGSLLTLLLLPLSSCQGTATIFSAYTYPTLSSITELPTSATYQHIQEYSSSFSDFYRSAADDDQRTYNLLSTGEQNILVLPIDFPSFPASSLKYGATGSRNIIENAFFGTEASTQWQSVASYYYQSSYGKLSLQGTVAPWYTVNDQNILNQIQAFETNSTNTSKTTITNEILRLAVAYYQSTLIDTSLFKAEFDRDNNDVIDAVFLVYSHPIGDSSDTRVAEENDSSSLFWAFSAHDTTSTNIGTQLRANAYSWASYDFLYTDYSPLDNLPDCHTYIHEVGHLLGLEDYYNTSADGISSPTGGMDMMDYSLGDQTAFSKMLLGWTFPYVIRSSGSITLRPFYSSGDVALIGLNWNGNVFSEYLLVEYYAPRGLNYYDAEYASGVRLFSDYGVKIYHVSAGVSYKSMAINGVNTLVDGVYRYTNSPTRAMEMANTPVLYQLLARDGGINMAEGEFATNAALYMDGSTFNDGNNSFKFNSGTPFPYKISFSQFTRQSVKISFTDSD